MAGARREGYYVQGSATYAERGSWDLSDDYTPEPGSLEDGGERLGSDNRDWRLNFKLGFTPNDTDEYTVNYIGQAGEKGAPLNVYNNPPVPPNSFWRWPYWDVQNTSFLTTTRLGDAAYIKTRTYYNTFENGLEAYDDISYSTQDSPRAFFSPYDDHAYGTSLELGTTRIASNTLKVALHYRRDFHTEQQTSRPTSETMVATEPEQNQAQTTWSIAVENTYRANADVDVVLGVSYDEYEITQAEEFDEDLSPDVFEYPEGGSDAFNWQSAVIWRYRDGAQLHASISDRGRFPTFFELYSTRFGTATPNPGLGPERATNVEIGWEATTAGGIRLGGAVFHNDVEDLIQTVVLPDTTTQAQNVGNYTHMDLKIEDALQPDLEADGVPDDKALLYATWRPVDRLTLTPSIEATSDRWSPVNPPVPQAYTRTGSYALVNVDASYAFLNGLALGAKNLLDENYELAWGFPEPGRSAYAKIRYTF
jgi:iron complex outermembrane receptor protein